MDGGRDGDADGQGCWPGQLGRAREREVLLWAVKWIVCGFVDLINGMG